MNPLCNDEGKQEAVQIKNATKEIKSIIKQYKDKKITSLKTGNLGIIQAFKK